MRRYKSIYGDLRIPVNYIIPNELPWTQDLCGMKLGHRVSHIRNRGDFALYRKQLDDLVKITT